MQVILLRDVESLGEEGTIVQVSDGYARNYLMPKRYAIAASPGALSDLERRSDQLKAKVERRYQENLQRAQQIEALGSLQVEANAGETGKLFGSVTTKELATMLSERIEFEVDRRSILVNKPINQVGDDYELTIRLSPRVTAKLQVKVNAVGGQETYGFSQDRIAEQQQVAAGEVYETEELPYEEDVIEDLPEIFEEEPAAE